jgi:hypothetical protein
VVLGDLTDENVEDIDDEIFSDMVLIAEDFFSWLQEEDGFTSRKSSNIQKFIDDTHDRVSGLVVRIDLSVVSSQNECAIPKVVQLPAE